MTTFTIRQSSIIAFSVAAVAAIGAPIVLANGVISERPAGGLVFTKSETIGIASEDLFLSIKEVRVAYVYNSMATKVQNVTISFPMPEMPVDGGPDSEVFNRLDDKDARNYMDFAVKVDGKPVAVQMREVAWLRGQDVTARLTAAGLPLLYVKNGQQALERLPQTLKDELAQEGLFIKSESDTTSYSPEWTYQVVFEWEQSFAPGNTKVDIRYKPILGDSADYGDYFERGEGVKRYCIDDAFRTALQRRRASLEPLRLGYVLKTARFWRGPIGRFRLVVDKEKATNLVAFCPLNAKRISETAFEWTATNFLPERDIEVVFFAGQ